MKLFIRFLHNQSWVIRSIPTFTLISSIKKYNFQSSIVKCAWCFANRKHYFQFFFFRKRCRPEIQCQYPKSLSVSLSVVILTFNLNISMIVFMNKWWIVWFLSISNSIRRLSRSDSLWRYFNRILFKKMPHFSRSSSVFLEMLIILKISLREWRSSCIKSKIRLCLLKFIHKSSWYVVIASGEFNSYI